MTRNSRSRNGGLRERIAHVAARIMAEDGVDDFGYAKRKAARQVGASDAGSMPDNDEVEQALATYRQVYQQEEHPDVLRDLREQALTFMQQVEQFQPHLSGPVLTGVAGKFSDIEILLFADTTKTVEIFLLNRGWRYRPSQTRCFVNQEERVIPVYAVQLPDAEVNLKVFDIDDQRRSIRSTAMGRPLQRANVSELEQLISESEGAAD